MSAASAIHARRHGHSQTLRATVGWPRSPSPRLAAAMAGRPRGLSLGQPCLAAGPGPKARPPLRVKTTTRDHACSYASRKSSREIELWRQITRRVDDLIVLWFGSVRGVFVPSAFSRTIAICSSSRITRNPRAPRAATTLAFEASLGILGISQRLQVRSRSYRRAEPGSRPRTHPSQTSRYEIE